MAKNETIHHTKGKRQQRLPASSSGSTEKNRDMGILHKVLGTEGASGRVFSNGGDGEEGGAGKKGDKKKARKQQGKRKRNAKGH